MKKFYISKEDLIDLFKSGLNATEICKKFSISYDGTLRKIMHNYGIRSRDYREWRADYNITKFDEIDTEEKAYWLGFLYADGCVRNGDHHNNTVNIQLNVIDKGHLQKFKLFMEDTRPESVIYTRDGLTPRGNPQTMVSYAVCSPHLRQSLINLGCVPNKSNILKFPSEDIFKRKELVYDFIRGYVDGDGCLYKCGKRLGMNIRSTLSFLEGIRNYFPEQFVKVRSEVDKKTKHTLYKLECCSDKADQVAFRLYENANIYLDRKYEKFTALCRLHNEKLGKNGED